MPRVWWRWSLEFWLHCTGPPCSSRSRILLLCTLLLRHNPYRNLQKWYSFSHMMCLLCRPFWGLFWLWYIGLHWRYTSLCCCYWQDNHPNFCPINNCNTWGYILQKALKKRSVLRQENNNEVKVCVWKMFSFLPHLKTQRIKGTKNQYWSRNHASPSKKSANSP